MRARTLTALWLAACGADGDVAVSTPLPSPPQVVAPDWIDVLPNVDNRNDWANDPRADDDDLVELVVRVAGEPADSLRFDIDGSPRIRLWHEGEILLQGTSDKAWLPWPESGALSVWVEAGDFDVHGVIEVSARDADDVGMATAAVGVRSPPLLLNHHLQPAEVVMATGLSFGSFDNASFMQSFSDVMGPRFEAADGRRYFGDPWMQDEIEFAYGITPGGRTMRAVIDSIRDRGLDPYAEDRWRGEDFSVQVFGRGYANSLDSFGNLEVSPPIAGFPFGRIYYGAVRGYAPQATPLFDFLAEQGVQGPFEVDTSWLCVGHVDEFMTFLPDPTAPRGFRFVIHDADAAWAVLEGMDPATELPRWAGSRNHGYDTVGEIVADHGLRMLNEDLMIDVVEPILAQMTRELDLAPEEILRMPGLFEEPGYCGRTVAALIPGMANLTVADLGDGPQVFLADPFLRSDLADQASDPMIAAVTEVLPSSLDLHFVDDWEVYHLGLGEVHCGSNVLRTPSAADWWTDDAGGSR